MPLESFKKLMKVKTMRCMVHAVDQHVIHKSQGSLLLRDGAVHVALKRGPSIPQAKGQPLVLKKPKWSSDGHLGHIYWVDRDLVITFPEVNLRENCALATKSSMFGSR